MSPRHLTRVFRLIIGTLAVGLMLCGCSRHEVTLHIYNWADYIDPDIISQFEEEFDCLVLVDTYETNEELYDRVAGGANGFDILVPSSYMATRMREEGLLLPLDHKLISNLKHVDKSYLSDHAPDPTMTWSVPYLMGFTGVAWVHEIVGEVKPSWDVLDRQELSGNYSLLNDMRETLGAALKSLGYSLNSTDPEEIREAGEVLKRWKERAAALENVNYDVSLMNRDYIVAMVYSGDALTVAEEDDTIRFMIPQEGASLFCDDLVIPANSPQPALAHAFIDFIHRPEIAAQNMNWAHYRSPNTAAMELVDEQIRNHPAMSPSEEVMEKCEFIRDLHPATLSLYEEVWQEALGGEEPPQA